MKGRQINGQRHTYDDNTPWPVIKGQGVTHSYDENIPWPVIKGQGVTHMYDDNTPWPVIKGQEVKTIRFILTIILST